MRIKGITLFAVAVAAFLFVYACDAIEDEIEQASEQDREVEVDLGNFILTGGSQIVLINPECGQESLNDLLAYVSNWEDIAGHLRGINIKQALYRVPFNSTPAPIHASLQVSDPDTGVLETVGSADIEAGATVEDWTELPLTGDGEDIIGHYLEHRGETFVYCMEGSPDEDLIEMTIGVRLVVEVTVSL